MKIFYLALTILGLFFITPIAVLAHPGATDNKGGHTCYTNCSDWGLHDNEYHYHNANGTPIITYDNNKDFYDQSLAERLKGRILLQVEDHGEAWFIRKEDEMRYYMPDGNTAYQMMRFFSLGISDADLDKIPKVANSEAMNKSTSICKYNSLANRLKGEILLQVDQHGEAYYVDPVKCRAIYMQDGDAAYQIMRYLGLGASNQDISKIVLGGSDTYIELLLAFKELNNKLAFIVDPTRDHIRGLDNAKVTMVVYSDFQCPYCAKHAETLENLMSLYRQDVRMVYRHFPLAFHEYAQKAAEASECADDQNKFWEMHDELFKLSKVGLLNIENIKQAAADMGLDRDQFNSCLDSGIKAERVLEDYESGQDAGVQGTPATFIDGQLISGAVPLDTLVKAVQDEGAEN